MQCASVLGRVRVSPLCFDLQVALHSYWCKLHLTFRTQLSDMSKKYELNDKPVYYSYSEDLERCCSQEGRSGCSLRQPIVIYCQSRDRVTPVVPETSTPKLFGRSVRTRVLFSTIPGRRWLSCLRMYKRCSTALKQAASDYCNMSVSLSFTDTLCR
jgi:hypothetical protein